MARPVRHTIEFPYTRSLGPIIGAFAEGLEAGKILASRAGGKVLCPPLEYDPYTGESAEAELVEGARVALGHAYGGAAQYFAMWVVSSERQPF